MQAFLALAAKERARDVREMRRALADARAALQVDVLLTKDEAGRALEALGGDLVR